VFSFENSCCVPVSIFGCFLFLAENTKPTNYSPVIKNGGFVVSSPAQSSDQQSAYRFVCPCDNAVAEATFKIIKTEFVYGEIFENLHELQYKLADYVDWFNKEEHP